MRRKRSTGLSQASPVVIQVPDTICGPGGIRTRVLFPGFKAFYVRSSPVPFSTLASAVSGVSNWSSIRHLDDAADALRVILVRQLMPTPRVNRSRCGMRQTSC